MTLQSNTFNTCCACPAVVELKSGKKLDASLVVVGVGAKPNTELFKGQLDLLEDKPGGVKVSHLHFCPLCSQYSTAKISLL